MQTSYDQGVEAGKKLIYPPREAHSNEIAMSNATHAREAAHSRYMFYCGMVHGIEEEMTKQPTAEVPQS